MTDQSNDRRLTPARPDLAAASLEGKVEAERFAEAEPARIAAATVPLRPEPRGHAVRDTTLLMGADFDIYERRDGWVWGQHCADGYVGYAPEAVFLPREGEATHVVAVPATHLYGGPTIKADPFETLYLGSRVRVADTVDTFAVLEDEFHLPLAHLVPAEAHAPDYVNVAGTLLGAPYLWGGNTVAGIDCSALVQVALARTGQAVLRDTDMQAGTIGEALPADAPLRRGDLIYWQGHVGILTDAETLLHATAHSMRCLIEPLATVRSRIEGEMGIPFTGFRRPAPAA